MLKMTLLLHKTASANFPMATTVKYYGKLTYIQTISVELYDMTHSQLYFFLFFQVFSVSESHYYDHTCKTLTGVPNLTIVAATLVCYLDAKSTCVHRTGVFRKSENTQAVFWKA